MEAGDRSLLPGFQWLVVEVRVADERVEVEVAHAGDQVLGELGWVDGKGGSKPLTAY
jgi:hypothetical protein